MDEGYAEQRRLIVAEISRDRLALEQAIDGLRGQVESLRENVERRVDRVRRRVDLRRHVRAAPYGWLFASAALGVWLGLR